MKRKLCLIAFLAALLSPLALWAGHQQASRLADAVLPHTANPATSALTSLESLDFNVTLADLNRFEAAQASFDAGTSMYEALTDVGAMVKYLYSKRLDLGMTLSTDTASTAADLAGWKVPKGMFGKLKAAVIAGLRRLGAVFLKGALKYIPSSGVPIRITTGKTTTILGRFMKDMQAIITELGIPKSFDFGPKPGRFNVLNCPDDPGLTDEQFWTTYNKPFLDLAIARDDIFQMATRPAYTERYNERGEITGFGREYQYMLDRGYTYDSATSRMIRR